MYVQLACKAEYGEQHGPYYRIVEYRHAAMVYALLHVIQQQTQTATMTYQIQSYLHIATNG